MNMKCITLAVFVTCWLPLVSQVNKLSLLKEAEYFFEYNNYSEALPYYRNYLKLDTINVEVHYKTALCIYNTTYDKREAIGHFEKAKELFPESYFYLGKLYHYNEDFQNALANYSLYKQKNSRRLVPDSMLRYYEDQTLRAKIMLSSPCVASITNMGAGINSKYPDYVPILLRDESVMFFTSRRGSGDDPKDPNGNYFEDIYWAMKYEDGWGNARPLSFPVNTQTHESCLGVSPDLSSIFLYRTNEEGTGGGVYESAYDAKDKSWSTPKYVKAGFNSKDPNVKTVCLVASPDSNTYFFVSNMPGGMGGTDIWRIVRYSDKEWSQPENVGTPINTPFDEDSPSFFPDENTMYFSSNGHDNIGDFDIFKTEKVNGLWTKPKNMGCPVNSVRDDRFFSISPDGKRGYYSTQREDTKGETDIYQIEMEQLDQKFRVVKGYVRDLHNKLPICAEITLIEMNQKKIAGVFRPNKFSGNYVLIVNNNTKYSIEVRASGYKTKVIAFTVPRVIKGDLFDANILMVHE